MNSKIFFWKAIAKVLPLLEFVLFPFTFLASIWFLIIRRSGIERAPISKRIFLSVGIFPIRDHYYEPLFNASYIGKNRGERFLPGVDLNVKKQLDVLAEFNFAEELRRIPTEKASDIKYYYNNPSFFAGDAEYLYNIIRLKKPRRIIEVGSGFSTLMMLEAIRKNETENSTYSCEVTCIEPYEMPWLEKTGVKVIRKKVQEIDRDLFKGLQENDILFIDSSHVIRPDGDVLFEYLEILPVINSGVIVHIHDIYTPRDYPKENFEKYVVFINEQYLVEAFLTLNRDFEIIGAVNFLTHDHFEAISTKCPMLALKNSREPRSLWLMRRK